VIDQFEQSLGQGDATAFCQSGYRCVLVAKSLRLTPQELEAFRRAELVKVGRA